MKKLYPALGLAIAMALVSNPANAGGVADNAKPVDVALVLDTSPPALMAPASEVLQEANVNNEVAIGALPVTKSEVTATAATMVAGAASGTATIGATAHEVACASLMSGDVVLRL